MNGDAGTNLSLDGQVIDKRTVRFQRLLPGPIERVWTYLAEPEKRARWFAGGEVELCAGGGGELFFRHANLMGPDEIAPEKYQKAVDGVSFPVRITQCEPPHVFAFSWGDADGAESEVVFELARQGERVLLTLTHSKLPSRAELVNVSGGWHLHLTFLQHELEGTTPPAFWPTQAKLERKYDREIP